MAGRTSEPRRLLSWNTVVVPLCLISLVLSGTALINSNSQQRRSVATGSGNHWARALDGIVQPSTARSIQEDELLHHTYVTAVGISADAADWLAARYPSNSLNKVRDLLDVHAREVSSDEQDDATAEERGLSRRANPFAALFPGLPSADPTALLGGVGDMLKKGLSGIGQDLLNDVAGAGFFLGAGIGQGSASGLNLTTADKAKLSASKVASSNNMTASGLNPTIQNLGNSLAGTLTGAINISSFGGGLDVRGAAGGLATGIGTGFVDGLKIKALPAPPPTTPNGTGIADIVSQFGFSLVDTVASNVNLGSFAGAVNFTQVLAAAPSVALGFAQGLGSGTVNGIKLNLQAAPSTGSGIPDIANNFGFGLSQSVTSNIDFAALGTLAASQGGNLMAMLPAAASGLGKGLGEGIPMGLGFQPDMGVIPSATPGGFDISSVTENFGMGLTSRILANGTISKLMSMQSPGGGVLGGVDFGKAAGGFARGFLQGAGDAVTAMGGVQALVDGTSTSLPSTIQDTAIQFNDSVNGAAIGFGQGFGSQGVLVAKSLIGQVKATAQKRHAEHIERSLPTTGDVELVPRQAATLITPDGTSTTFNLSGLLDAETISTFLQKGIDVLGCEGVGGLVLVLQGVTNSGMLPVDPQSLGSLSKFKDMIPKGVLHFTSQGNTYRIDLTFIGDNLDNGVLTLANGVEVNGNKVIQLAVFLALHILLGLAVLIFIVPIIMGMEGARNMLVRIRKPQHLLWVPKWANLGWILLVGPLLILVLIFGVLVVGSTPHFRTGHGIVGLITVLDGLFSVALQMAIKFVLAIPTQASAERLRGLNNQLLGALAAATVLSGFTDLSAITVCITRVVPLELGISIGFGLASVYTIGNTISQLDMFLMYREARNARKNGGKAPESDLKQKIKVVV